jgi:hypothetical protein
MEAAGPAHTVTATAHPGPTNRRTTVMTQLQQAGHRTTVVTSAIVAAAVSAAITVSGLLIVPALTAVQIEDASNQASLDRAVDAGRAWQRQRMIESPAYYTGLHAAEQAGLEWQLRYEQTNPNR